MIDNYCERIGPGLWAEPLNALSNLSFLIAAFVAWRLLQRGAGGEGGHKFLVLLIATIGIGSGLFHTYATVWAKWLDVIPIFLFQLTFLCLYCRQVIRWSALNCAMAVALFLMASIVALQFPLSLNGSAMYLPAISVLLLLGSFHYLTNQNGRLSLLLGALVFCASLAFRTVDAAVCELLTIGTHFMWHLLNGVVLYLLVRALVVARSELWVDHRRQGI